VAANEPYYVSLCLTGSRCLSGSVLPGWLAGCS
jgi:hypothetical protein